MVCKNCGNFVADGHSFCSNCGAKIQIAPAPGSNRKKSGSAAVWIIVAAAAAGGRAVHLENNTERKPVADGRLLVRITVRAVY